MLLFYQLWVIMKRIIFTNLFLRFPVNVYDFDSKRELDINN